MATDNYGAFLSQKTLPDLPDHLRPFLDSIYKYIVTYSRDGRFNLEMENPALTKPEPEPEHNEYGEICP